VTITQVAAIIILKSVVLIQGYQKIKHKEVSIMKSFLVSIVLALSIFIACSAQAQLVVYDDFTGPFVDTERWRPNTTWGDNVAIYEGGFRILKGKLSIFNRAYGAQLATDLTQHIKRQLFLRNVSDVTSIEASIQIVKAGHEITGCSENPEHSETRVWIGGSFFNDGTGTSGSGDYKGDILAATGLYRISDSADPAGYLGVRARVLQCTNADCSTYNKLFETLYNDRNGKPLLLKVGKKEKFRITYDQASNTFTFQVGKKNIVTYDCDDDGVSNVKASGAVNGGMRLEVVHYLANCPSPAARTVGWADVLFDYISVD